MPKIHLAVFYLVLLLSLTIVFLQTCSLITTSFAQQQSPPQQQRYKQIIDLCSQAAHDPTISQDQAVQCDKGMLFLQGQCEKQLLSADICSDLRLNNYITTRGLLSASRPESLPLSGNEATTIASVNQTNAIQPPMSPVSPSPSLPPTTMPQQTSPSSTSQTIPPAEQQSLQSVLPGLMLGEQPPQPIAPSQQGLMEGFKSNGTINSVIFTPTAKWIAAGNLSMQATNGNLTYFITNMTWYNENGTATHTHEIQNFRPAGVVQTDNSLFLKGLVDVGTNNHIVWKNVHSTINIRGGKTIAISLDDNDTKHHFAGQPIYGVITLLTRCSDVPGPDMQVLPSCTSPTS